MKICRKGHKREDSVKNCLVCRRAYQKKRDRKFKEFSRSHSAEKRVLFGPSIDFSEYKRKAADRERRAEEKQLKKQESVARQNRRQLERSKERRRVDPAYRIKCNLRKRLWDILKGKTKLGSSIKDLGCTGEELKTHLESQFEEGMTWDNYGINKDQWSIDHIIPLSSVDLTNREEFLKVNHYTNLRPMWHIENLKKGNKFYD